MSNFDPLRPPAELLCCHGAPCGQMPGAARIANTYGARKLAALCEAGYAVMPAAELVALREAVALGTAARQAQSRYFRDRSRDNLIASKEAERRFDQAAAAIAAAPIDPTTEGTTP